MSIIIVDHYGLDQTKLIKYHINSQGFRSLTEYDYVPDYEFFGCSLVFGIGVEIEDIFASKFSNAHNYGLAGTYTNLEIYQTILNFINSNVYSPSTKLCVVWKDQTDLTLCEQLEKYNIVQFFCNCALKKSYYSMIKQVDSDVSNTHMGPNTHLLFSRLLCTIFNQ